MREGAGLTLQQLADLAGCSAGYLSRVERRERQPSRIFLDHVSRVLAEAIKAAS